MNAPITQRGVPIAFVFFLCLGFAMVRGQTPAAAADIPALRVAVSSISESRSSQRPATLTLILSITGEGLSPDVVLKGVIVTKAMDNLGNVLGSNGVWGPIGGVNVGVGRGGTGPLTARIGLDAPGRQAESLAYVEGTIELFLRSEANDGSMISVPKTLNHAGSAEDPASAKQRMESLFISDRASYDRAKQQAAGVPAGAVQPGSVNAGGYSFRDLSGGLVAQQLQGAHHIRPLAPVPTEAEPAVFIPSPAATKSVPFRVEEIALP